MPELLIVVWLSVIECELTILHQLYSDKERYDPSLMQNFYYLSLHFLIIILTRKRSTDLKLIDNFFHLRFIGLIFTISMIPNGVYSEYKNTLPTVAHDYSHQY